MEEARLSRLRQQLDFILEIDRLKEVVRRSYLIDGSRLENSAEHSWHLAMMSLLLCEFANEPVDPVQVMKMVLIHDIVEIDAGDTFLYDLAGAEDKAERETAAAERLFGILPPDQTAEMQALWREFEERRTPEARFAHALDRFMPLLHNYHTQGRGWHENGIVYEQVVSRTDYMAEGSRELWDYARAFLLRDAVAKGYLSDDEMTVV